jgi:5-formyltetrahydrofolate cyclo-ligase
VDKQAIREWVWRELEDRGAAAFPKPVRGRIPNFVGSAQAAQKLRSLEAYRSAKTVFVNPDAAQMPVRENVLRDEKLLVMATPKLRKGFILLDPLQIEDTKEASSIRGAFKYGKTANIGDLRIDLIVEGSVAVDRKGGRLGKHGGFGDLEFAILREIGAVDDRTPIATTVHPIQIVEEVPVAAHDVPVDFIVTPESIVETSGAHPRPKGIIWELLPSDALKQMPMLAELRRGHDTGRGRGRKGPDCLKYGPVRRDV